MLLNIMRILVACLVLIFLSACGSNDSTINLDESINLGRTTFEANCMICHGAAGQGLVKDWKKPLPNGKYPPPPLNGTAHTWHHSPKILLKTINDGGIMLGGAMLGFKDKLNNKEKQALIDYIYSLWPKNIKDKYDKHFKK